MRLTKSSALQTSIGAVRVTNAPCDGLVAIADAWFKITDAKTVQKARVLAATVAVIVPSCVGYWRAGTA